MQVKIFEARAIDEHAHGHEIVPLTFEKNFIQTLISSVFEMRSDFSNSLMATNLAYIITVNL